MISRETAQDSESTSTLQVLQEEELVRKHRVENVRTILVVLSGRAIVYDDASLRQKIQLTYPDAKIYFMTTEAYALGEKLPGSAKIDLVIDFTGPGHRHKWLWARKLRARARVCVGRPAGLFREHIYDRLSTELQRKDLPRDVLDRERLIQREVLALAGVPLSHKGNSGADQGKTIASRLPPLGGAR
ncbi:MAG: hypothetical protein JST04_05525 [Bdellovibrionales bacterium]|nr:hypothetical protein [Bdellovibrionales bacterium]